MKLILKVDTQPTVYCFYVSLTAVLSQFGASRWNSMSQQIIALRGLTGSVSCSFGFLGGVMHLGAGLILGLLPWWFRLKLILKVDAQPIVYCF